MTTSTTSFLPAWFRRWNQYPTAGGAWVNVRLPANERSVLISTQRDFNQLMLTMPKGHVNTIGKQRWCELRIEYARTRSPDVLAELGKVGDKGSLLTNELRQHKHAIRAAGRQLAAARGCRAIYHRVFGQAAAIVLQRISADEKDERVACAEAKLDFQPSEYLWSMGNLARLFQTDAEVYAAEKPEGDPAILLPPAQALGDLWPNILKEGKK